MQTYVVPKRLIGTLVERRQWRELVFGRDYRCPTVYEHAPSMARFGVERVDLEREHRTVDCRAQLGVRFGPEDDDTFVVDVLDRHDHRERATGEPDAPECSRREEASAFGFREHARHAAYGFEDALTNHLPSVGRGAALRIGPEVLRYEVLSAALAGCASRVANTAASVRRSIPSFASRFDT
jgi:hypothetical protein